MGRKRYPKQVLLHVINLFKEGFDNFSEYSDEFYQKIIKGQITLSAKVSISLLYYTYNYIQIQCLIREPFDSDRFLSKHLLEFSKEELS